MGEGTREGRKREWRSRRTRVVTLVIACYVTIPFTHHPHPPIQTFAHIIIRCVLVYDSGNVESESKSESKRESKRERE